MYFRRIKRLFKGLVEVELTEAGARLYYNLYIKHKH